MSSKPNRAERKAALQASAEKSLEAIQNQLGDFKKIGTNALIIGGTIVAAYAITELLLPPAQKKIDYQPLNNAVEENEEESILWAGLKGIATSLLLAVAKEKLVDLIEQLTDKDAKTSAE